MFISSICRCRSSSLFSAFAAIVTLLYGSIASAQASNRVAAFNLEKQGQFVEAEQAWKSVVASDPSNAEAFAHLGFLASHQEHYTEAIADYEKAEALAPSMPGLRMNLGLALFKANQFPAAIQNFSAQLRQHPDTATAAHLNILLGMAHYGMGDYFVAIPFLERAAERDTQSLPVRITLAHSCLWSKQYDCVLSVYKEILALNADSAEADMLAGEALDAKGDDAAAIEQFRAATRANPQQPTAHFGLGYLLWREQHFAEALPEFQAELVIDPAQSQARAYLADCLIETVQFEKARPFLEQIIQEHSAAASTAMVHRDLGIVYAEGGKTEAAEKELQEAISLDSTYVSAHWRLAKIYQAAGKKVLAKAEFDTVSEMKRKSSRPLTQALEGASPPALHP